MAVGKGFIGPQSLNLYFCSTSLSVLLLNKCLIRTLPKVPNLWQGQSKQMLGENTILATDSVHVIPGANAVLELIAKAQFASPAAYRLRLQAERRLKLADAEDRYRLRTELELVTTQVIVQPKLTLDVQIVDRGTFVQRRIVWDPLLHCIEPLRCDVCGLPGMRLHLCNGGHLAHSDCLLEQQCVDCKRVYCRLCQEQMSTCVVCGRPTCLSSLNTCSECGRGTCREHRWLCHADDGMPIKVSEPSSDLDRKGP